MALRVVNHLQAINSASSFPATAIRRSAAPVIEPSGKAIWAAISNRSGVVGVTVPGAGGRRLLPVILRRPEKFRQATSAAPSSKMNLS
jgi:hypothetical protein